MRPAPTFFIPMLPWLLLLGSCSTPPKPPTVDESKKHPANDAVAVDLQSCRNELQDTGILLAEATRSAQASAALAQQARQLALRPVALEKPAANGIYTVRFDFGKTRVAISPEVASALLDDARNAPLVLLRGRTDGTADSLAESRIARERAAAVRDYLLAAGIDPTRIRATYQPIGDHAADNSTAAGRSINRRVEIEVYRAAPVDMTPAVVTQP